MRIELATTEAETSTAPVLLKEIATFKATIMDKSSCRTPRKKTCFVERVSFSVSNFHISTPPSPFQCCDHLTVSTERVLTLKRGEEDLAIDKKDVFFFSSITKGRQ